MSRAGASVEAAGTPPGAAPSAGGEGRTLVRQTGGMAASLYVSRLSVLVRGVLAARLLGPAGFGVWNALQLIWEYGQFAHLGVLNGLNKEIAFRLGTGERDEAARQQDAGYGSMLVTAVVGWVLLLAVVALRRHGAEGRVWLVGAAIAGTVVIVEEVLLLYQSVLRAYGVISLISKTEILYALTNLGLSIAALWKFGLYGLLVAWLVTRTGALLYLVSRAGLRMRPRWDRARTIHLLRRGGWIFVYLALALLLRTVDRAVTLSGLGVESLGYYALAATVAGLVAMIPNAVVFVIYPVFLKRFGETRDPRALRRDLERATLALATGIPLLLLFLELLVPAGLCYVLPGYLQAVPAMRLLLIGSLFAGFSQVPIFFLLAVDRDPWLVLMSAGGAALGVFACVSAVHAGYGIVGVAVGKAAADLIYGGSVVWFAGTLSGGSFRAGGLFLARCVVPAIVVCGGAALAVGVLGRPAWIPASPELGLSVARALLATALAAPFLWLFARRAGLAAVWESFLAMRRRGGSGSW